MFITHGPEIVYEGESNVHKWKSIAKFDGILGEIWSFHGLDRGDVVEMDTEVWDHDRNRPLYLRSDHKESLSHFDAWKNHVIQRLEHVDYVRISFLCRYNGPSAVQQLKTHVRPHWGVHLLGSSPDVTVRNLYTLFGLQSSDRRNK